MINPMKWDSDRMVFADDDAGAAKSPISTDSLHPKTQTPFHHAETQFGHLLDLWMKTHHVDADDDAVSGSVQSDSTTLGQPSQRIFVLHHRQ